MKTPYKDIYNILKLNRFIVLAVVICATITSTMSVVLILKLHKDTINSAFVVNSEGQVIPLKLVSQKENLEVEILSHLELFHQYFYNIDASNYEKNLGKALWLGNGSVDAVYRQKKADGVYNRLLQYSLVQKVISVASKINIQKEPYSFETLTIFEVNRGSVIDTYELKTTGNVIHVDRNFPKNTHGLLITNFFENSLRKIDNKERS
ncbi:conjugal transfer protein TraK [Confluentibacter sediminis]|uniref:conjugal transfer protein TraK n=1 Tax=Confluentibacter sediminis TaxID=2219045 RepID=UPI000DABBBD0|nr:conjugal transfer protein TraK [Confluentibacter sediminis]